MAGDCSGEEAAEDYPLAQLLPEVGLSPGFSRNNPGRISPQHLLPQQHFPVFNLKQLNPVPQAVPWIHGEVGPDDIVRVLPSYSGGLRIGRDGDSDV